MTRLGSDKKLRKGGRYARVMGTLWRCSKREQCGRAAMGLLLDIWSWCADQQQDVIPEKALRKLLAGDSNGRKQLRELVAARFLDEVEGGFRPHDWDEHSGAPETNERGSSDRLSDSDRDGLSDGTATGSATKPTTETIQESTSSRERAFPISHIPIREEEKREREKESEDASARGADSGLDAFARTRCAVRQEFARRFHEAEPQAGLWTRASGPEVDTLTSWLLSLPSDPLAALQRTLDAFFADPYCRSIHFSVSHLARHPQRYLDPRPAPVSTPRSANSNGRRVTPSPGTTEDDFALDLEEQRARQRAGG